MKGEAQMIRGVRKSGIFMNVYPHRELGSLMSPSLTSIRVKSWVLGFSLFVASWLVSAMPTS